jgi:hypothetical protein
MEQCRKFELVDEWAVDQSPTVWEYIGTGRAKCRLCGKVIEKGDKGFGFFFSLTDGGSYNSWTAIEGKAHLSCYPNVKIEYTRCALKEECHGTM